MSPATTTTTTTTTNNNNNNNNNKDNLPNSGFCHPGWPHDKTEGMRKER